MKMTNSNGTYSVSMDNPSIFITDGAKSGKTTITLPPSGYTMNIFTTQGMVGRPSSRYYIACKFGSTIKYYDTNNTASISSTTEQIASETVDGNLAYNRLVTEGMADGDLWLYQA